MKKSSLEIITECTYAVRDCYNRYSDKPMEDCQFMAIRRAIYENLPLFISTREYNEVIG